MGASIVFNGHDLSDVTTAEVIEQGAQRMAVVSEAVPGSAARLVTDVAFEPFQIVVRLMLKTGLVQSDVEMSALRRRLRAALSIVGLAGGVLRVPEEPELEWRGVFAVDVESWDSLFEQGSTTVVFESYDAVAYGADVSVSTSAFEVGGSWPAAPVFTLVAAAGSALQVRDGAGGAFVRVERAFSGGEQVVVDCGSQTVRVDGVCAETAVTLMSDFFLLEPGLHEIFFEGVTSEFTIDFTERWL